MISYKSFCDLSICETRIPELKEMCGKLVELGYRTIAVNQIIDNPQFSSGKRTKDEASNPIPEPVPLEEIRQMFGAKLTIVNRLTFGVSDQTQAMNITSNQVTKKYDLLAAIPKTQSAYNIICTSLSVDIVSFDPANRYPVKQTRKMYNVAARRGLYFELMYTPAASDGFTRQNIISRGHQYYYFGKSKNILITSNGSVPLQLKGPYDVVCIGLLFGLSEEQSKYAVSVAGKKVLCHGVSRKLGKMAPILMKITSDNSEDEGNMEHDQGSVKKRPRL